MHTPNKPLEKIPGLTSPAPRGALLSFNHRKIDCLVIPLKISDAVRNALQTAEFSHLRANTKAHKCENSSLKFQPQPDGTTGLIENAFSYRLTQNHNSYQSMRLREVACELFSRSPQCKAIAELHRKVIVTFNQIILPRHTALDLKFHYNFYDASSDIPMLPSIANEANPLRRMSKSSDDVTLAFSLLGPLGHILPEPPSPADIPVIQSPEYSSEYPEEVASAQDALIKRFGGIALPSPAIVILRKNQTGPVLLGPVRHQALRSVGGYGTARCL